MTGQALARTEAKPALTTGGNVAAIIPRTIEETFRLAGALSSSGLAPSSLNSPEKVMVAILAGAELGLPPFQAMQSFAVINGRPAIWGDGLIAVVRSNGFKVHEWLEGEGDEMVAHCVVTRPDNSEEIARTFSVSDAKKANLWGKTGPWQTTPKRMLSMRARGFACRDGAADVLRGFQLREEVEDYQTIHTATAPQPSGLAARLGAPQAADEGFNASRAAQDAAEIETAAHDAETGEVIDGVVEELAGQAEVTDAHFPGDKPVETQAAEEEGPAAWLADARRHFTDAGDMPTLKAVDDQLKTSGRYLAIKAYSKTDYADLIDLRDTRAAEIEKAEAGR